MGTKGIKKNQFLIGIFVKMGKLWAKRDILKLYNLIYRRI